MATNFPTSLDALTNPQGTDSVEAVSHAAQHANANDAIEALEARVGVTGSTVDTSLTYRIATLEGASVDTEAIQDIIGLMVESNTETNVEVTYNDTTGKLNFDATAAVIAANDYTDIAVADLGNSLPNAYVPIGDVGNADGVASLDENGFVPNTQLNIDERIQDTASLMITSATHNNITVDYDDNTGKLSFTGIPLTQEQVQDFIAPLFAHNLHTNITATYDDTNNKVLLESSGGGGGSGTGGSLTNSWWLGA